MKLKGYVKKFGKRSFEEFALGEVDSVIFAILSYLDWGAFGLPMDKEAVPLKIKDINTKEQWRRLSATRCSPKSNRRFWKALITSKRFGEVSAAYFSSSFSTENVLQFAAVTFFLPDGRAIIAYRGTDASVIGWREDFNMALFDTVPSQKKALEYLDAVTGFFPGSFFISGHSKGGNLALYSATHTTMENKERLIMARSHDGPGFRDVDSHIDALIPILRKVSSTVPQDSIVGALLGFKRNSKIVRSKAFLLMQHDPFSWVVDKRTGDFVYLNYRKNSSLRREVAVSHWLASLADEDKRHIIDLCFLLLDPDGNGKVDFFHKRLVHMAQLMKRYKKMPDKDKGFFRQIFKRLFLSFRGTQIDQLTYKKITIFDESVKKNDGDKK